MTMLDRTVLTTLLSAGLLLCSSCGNDESEGSGVADSTALTALTDSEARALCHDWEKEYKDGLPSEQAFCTAFAGDADLSSDICEANLQLCLEEEEYAAEKADDWECDLTSAEEFAGEEPCTATVGEWRACVDAQLKRFKSLAQRASCDDPSSFEDAWEEPPECDVILRKCPDADT